ncbi:MAG: hypothetical protein SGJ03_11270, partial [Alphaproteobacteria bacterium]|nr:hypothetical protein [Alphaproteobacteria bacterium]
MVGGLDAHRRVDGKPAAVCPLRHGVRVITLEQTAAHEALQESPPHLGLHRGDGRRLDRGGLVEDDTPGRRGSEHAVEDSLRNYPAGGRPVEFRVGVADAVPKSIAYRLIEP